MQIRCDNCQAAYDVDPPAGGSSTLREMMFRCTSCGRTFPISFGEPAITSVPDAVAVPATEPEANGLLLKQDGKVYHVQDMAKLQRWIAERRVLGTDEVSRSGGDWQAVGKIDELSVFFQLLDQAEQSEDAVPESASEPTASLEQTEMVVEEEELELGVTLPPVELALPEEEPPEEELVVDGIPDESELPPADTEVFGPDDPTMDLGEDVGAFFADETGALSDPDQALFDAHTEEYDPDDDPDFVWASQRRRQTFIWWTVLFVIGTGLGLFVFDHLNKMDDEKSKRTKTKKSDSTKADAKAKAKAAKAKAAKAKAAKAKAAKADAKAAKAPDPADAKTPDSAEKKKEEKKEKKKSARSEINKGWKAYDSGKLGQARDHFKASMNAGGGTEARFGLARVLEKQGDKAGASRLYCKVVKSGRGEDKSVSERRLEKLGHRCP